MVYLLNIRDATIEEVEMIEAGEDRSLIRRKNGAEITVGNWVLSSDRAQLETLAKAIENHGNKR